MMYVPSYQAIYSIILHRLKEYFSEYHYSILSPLITTILFIIIFSTINDYYSIKINQKSFIEFLIPGLILMVVAQESFDRSSSYIINMKLVGSFDDYLMAPIYRFEIFISFIVSSIITGLFLGVLNYIIIKLFFDFLTINYLFFIFYLALTIIFFSSLGSIVGFLSFTWDSQSTISNFFVAPINLLSGTFFSISSLPDSFKFLFLYNPYYYVVNNFRNSFYSDYIFNFYENMIIMFFLIVFLILSAFVYIKGYKVIK